jgi:PLP dependent protein
VTDLTENFRRVQRQIETAARVANRDLDTITLVAVSKTRPAGEVLQLAALGQRHFGENQVQEGIEKIRGCEDASLTWHFIGRLQSNKARLVAEHFQWVHSLDRTKIADRLDAHRPPGAPPLNICLQVSMGDEASKGGIDPEALPALAAHVAGLPGLRLRGLMCLPPPPHQPQDSRPWFARLRALAERLQAQGFVMDQLSMGMSADLETAITEGATLVRVGSAIFGQRLPAPGERNPRT